MTSDYNSTGLPTVQTDSLVLKAQDSEKSLDFIYAQHLSYNRGPSSLT
jgi:hypothetical protein